MTVMPLHSTPGARRPNLLLLIFCRYTSSIPRQEVGRGQGNETYHVVNLIKNFPVSLIALSKLSDNRMVST